MADPVEEFLRSHVDRGTIPGGVIAVVPPGEVPRPIAAGVAEIDGEPLRPDAIFRIASMTKAVTATAALQLVEAGSLTLDTAVDEWMPELAARRVLTSPEADLDDTVPADRPITLRHLLTNTSGYGSIMVDSPLQHAMEENGTAGGPEPVSIGADEWLARLADLPLAFPPGEGWRYHQSFSILGILLSRVSGRPLPELLRSQIFAPLDMRDTGFWVPEDDAHRLPAAYRHGDDAFVETEPAASGFYVGPPPFDISHGELVSTAHDWVRFLRMLAGGGELEGRRLLSPDHVALMTSDQTPDRVKTPDSFFPGFWDGIGWGFGVSVETSGPHAGRYGWSGGVGTDFFVDPDGTVAVLLTQTEFGDAMMPLLGEFQQLVGMTPPTSGLGEA